MRHFSRKSIDEREAFQHLDEMYPGSVSRGLAHRYRLYYNQLAKHKSTPQELLSKGADKTLVDIAVKKSGVYSSRNPQSDLKKGSETMWNLYIIKKKGGPRELFNKRPMSKDDIQELMRDLKKSGISYFDLYLDAVKASVRSIQKKGFNKQKLTSSDEKFLETARSRNPKNLLGEVYDWLKKRWGKELPVLRVVEVNPGSREYYAEVTLEPKGLPRGESPTLEVRIHLTPTEDRMWQVFVVEEFEYGARGNGFNLWARQTEEEEWVTDRMHDMKMFTRDRFSVRSAKAYLAGSYEDRGLLIRMTHNGEVTGHLTTDQFRKGVGAPKNLFLSDVVKRFNLEKARRGEGERAEIILESER